MHAAGGHDAPYRSDSMHGAPLPMPLGNLPTSRDGRGALGSRGILPSALPRALTETGLHVVFQPIARAVRASTADEPHVPEDGTGSRLRASAWSA